LLPDATALHLEAYTVDDATRQITLRVRSTQTSAPCPLCATPARRIHSDYGRTLVDLPWAQYRVCLQLRVRKWFCRQRLPVVAEPVSEPLTPRRATWLVLRRAEQRTEAEAQQLAQLHAQSAEVAEAIDLAQGLYPPRAPAPA
jgi:transposase